MSVSLTAPRPAAVSAVLARSHEWVSARRKSDGKPFFFIPGSVPGAVYMTAVDGCTCPAARHSATGTCKHQVAVRQFHNRRQPAFRQLAALTAGCEARGCPEDRERGERSCSRHVLVDAF